MLETTPPLDQAAEPEPGPAPARVADLSPAACAARLAEMFPALFTPAAVVPLKLRIRADIQQRAPGIFTRRTLSDFLHRHTTSSAYLKALVNAPQRLDLDGQPAGEVADEHRQAAAAELQRRREMHEARRAAEREAQRMAGRSEHESAKGRTRVDSTPSGPSEGLKRTRGLAGAEHEARRVRAAADAQRREREALVRAYETSTLTRSNFCALKGIAETQLEELLLQARQEATQARQAAPQRRPMPASAQAAAPSAQVVPPVDAAHPGPKHRRSRRRS